MDDTLLFIPPCCVDKKLPRAVMQAPNRALAFYTQGDVSTEKFYRAVAHLVSNPAVMVLAIPNMTKLTAALLRQCFDREWITDLVLSTSREVSTLIDTHLADYREHILYTASQTVSTLSSHMVLYSDRQALTLQGPLWEVEDAKCYLASYSMVYYPELMRKGSGDYIDPLMNILLPDVLQHRKQVKKDKREVISARLLHFLNHNFPPYKEATTHPSDPHLLQI